MMKDKIGYDDFSRLDFRVGRVVKADAPEWSNKLLRYEVDFGKMGKRIIFSGVRKWYKPEDLEGKQFIFLVNLEAKKMGEEESQGMIIMADPVGGDEDKPILIPLTVEVENGTMVR